MLVCDIMQAEVVTAPPTASLTTLLQLLQARGFRHVPIVDGQALVGIVSDRDVKQSMASAATSAEGRERDRLLAGLTAAHIMARSVRTIGPMFAVEDAVKLMVTHRISAVPVTDGGRLVGLVTDTDVLQLFARALGVMEPSSRVDVIVPTDGRAPLGDLIRAVEGSGARISSVMTLAAAEGGREVILRLATIDPGPATKAIDAAGFAVRGGAPRLPH